MKTYGSFCSLPSSWCVLHPSDGGITRGLMRQQTPLRALGASWVSAWGFPLGRPSATFDVLSPSGEAMQPSGFVPALFICLQSMVLYDYFCSSFVLHSFFLYFNFSFFPLSYHFSSFVYYYCHFVYWLYALFCMVPLCTASLSLLFHSFFLGPAFRVLLFILALNYIIIIALAVSKNRLSALC